MDKLMKFLGGQEFYELMQAYRHSAVSDQKEVTERFEEVTNAILESTGKRKFVITSVEYGPGDRERNYRVQLCHVPSGIKHWDGFTIPVENFGTTILTPGTKFIVEILDDK